MAYPAGYSSEEDDYGGFLSEDDYEPGIPNFNAGDPQEPHELTLEQKLNNLFTFIMDGSLTEVILAINEGIDVNTPLRDGWTPILLAASVGNAEIVSELINRGANVNSDRDKFTPLMAVCSCPDSTSPAPNRLQIINALIEHGANIEAITRKRQTALMYAASNGNVEILTRLVPVCNINAEDNQGWTALFWAVNDNQPEAVELLVNAGLRIDKIDCRTNTPLHYAVSQGFEDIVKILSIDEEEYTTSLDTQANLYDVEEIFKDLSPQFFRDISSMLYGMKCEQLINYFSKSDLLEFLCLDNNVLEEMGIELPYQRHRILTGLHKFHAHVYKQKSIPIIPKDAIYSTIDVGNALIAAVRQLIAMEASIKYISRISIDENTKAMEIPIKTVRMRLNRIKKTTKALNQQTNKWDSEIKPVDLVTNYMKYPKSRRWLKYLGCISILTVTVITFSKTRT